MLFTESDGDLGDYLAFNGLLENESINPDKENEAAIVPQDQLALESVEQVKVELDVETVITNGFLNEGATLLSDSAPEIVPIHAELDSTDV